MRLFITLLLCLVTGLPRLLEAGPSTSVLPPGIQYLGKATAYLRLQPGEDLAPQQLSEPQIAARFQPSLRQYPNFGADTGGYWYRFSLHNPGAQAIERVLHLGLRTDHRLFVHHPTQGDWNEIPAWKNEGWDLTFLLTLAPGEAADFYAYVRFPHPDGHFVRLELMDQEHYWQKEILEHGVAFFFYGAIVIMAGYNFVLFLGLRDLSYLYYVLFVLSSGLFQATFDGMGVNYLWPLLENSPHAARLSALFIVSGCLLTMRLFGTQQHIPRWHRVLVGFAWAAGALFLLGSLTSVGIWIDLAYGIGLLLPVVFLTTGVLSFRRVPRTATLFLLGWSSYTLSVSFLMLTMLGLVPGNIDLEHGSYAAKFGGLIEVTLFALALADRINQLRREKLQAQALLFAKEQETSQRLEGMVLERTALLNQTLQDLAGKNQLIEERNAALAEKSQQLQEALQLKDKFFSILAHDLRGPIGSMSVVFSLLKQKQLLFDADLLESLAKATSTIKHLLEDLLNWSLSQQGKLEVQASRVSLSQVAEGVVSLLQNTAEAKGVALECRVDSQAQVYADPSMVTTVLRNLVGNAIKFTPLGGRVALRCYQEATSWRFEVEDNGPGIPPDKRESLFALRGKIDNHSTRKSTSKGGLGLVLVKEFVELNNGEVGVDSEPGQGSRFWFRLPQAAPQAEAPAPLALPPGVKHFLVADDNPLHRRSVMQALNEIGVEFDLAFDGESAWEQAQAQRYDVVLMDIDMPRLSGVEVANRLKAQPDCPKIIALSGYSKEQVEQTFGSAPFDGYLHKPLEADRLRPLLARLFEAAIA